MRNVMAHAQKPDFVFPRKTDESIQIGGGVSSVDCGSRGVRISFSNAVYTTFGGGVRVLATHSIRQFPLHFPSRASPCATRFRTSSKRVKESRNSPGVAHRVPGGLGSQISMTFGT